MLKKSHFSFFKIAFFLFSALICHSLMAAQYYSQCRNSIDALCKAPQSCEKYTNCCPTCPTCQNAVKPSCNGNKVQSQIINPNDKTLPCCLCDSCCPLCLNNLTPDISWIGSQNISSVISGYIFAGYDHAQHHNGNFTLGGFNPVFNFLYQDIVLAEAEVDFEIDRKSRTIVRLDYASLDFFLHKYVTFIAGKFLSPLGQFMQNQKPAWINKLPSRPPGFYPFQAAPESEIGIELRGGFPICDMLLNYALYVGNGPEAYVCPCNNLIDYVIYRGFNADEDGHKIVGGRLGFLPWPCLELGVSAAHGRIGLFFPNFNHRNSGCNFNNCGSNSNCGFNGNGCGSFNNFCGFNQIYSGSTFGFEFFAPSCNTIPFDIRSYASYGADFSFRCDNFTFRGEYIRQNIKGNPYTLVPGNRWRAYYLQLAYRIFKFEPVIRYGNYKTFQNYYRHRQVAIGLDYWFAPSIVAKVAYEFNSGQMHTINNDNRFLFQVAYGF